VDLQPAIVRPDVLGRPHPDPRADPPTEVLDPSGARTTELHQVGPDTDPIPVVPRDAATSRLPIVETGAGARPEPADGATEASGSAGGPALALSALLAALAGLVSWFVAAHLVPVAAVGDAQLVVAAFLLAGGLAQLIVGVGLAHRVPAAGRRPGRLVWSALLLVTPLAGLVGLAYGLLTPRVAEIAAGPAAPPTTGLLLFVLACAGWGVLATYDVLLAAVGRPWWAVWRGGLFAAAQIGALVALVGVAGLGAYGVLQSWAGPIVVWVVLGCAVVAVAARRSGDRAGAATPFAPDAVWRIGVMLLHYQVPIVVTVRFGPETGAAFFVAWQVFMVVDLAAGWFMSSLSVSVAREAHRGAELVATARRRLLLVFLPALALGAALAGPLLGVFGAAYGDGAHLLRLLLLGLAFRLVVTHELGVQEALGRGAGFARLQLLSAVLVLAMAVVQPVVAGGVATLLPVAIGYIVVQVACAAAMLVLPAARRTDLEVRAP
jgi:hypothetical protein